MSAEEWAGIVEELIILNFNVRSCTPTPHIPNGMSLILGCPAFYQPHDEYDFNANICRLSLSKGARRLPRWRAGGGGGGNF